MADFAFRWARAYRIAALPFGVTPRNAVVTVEGDLVTARFGLWRAQTSLSNIASVIRSGPYSFPKTAGPAHLSFTDNGLTFATNGERGVCLKLHEPIRGLDPLGVLKHPGLTLTVDDIDGFVAAVT